MVNRERKILDLLGFVISSTFKLQHRGAKNELNFCKTLIETAENFSLRQLYDQTLPSEWKGQ